MCARNRFTSEELPSEVPGAAPLRGGGAARSAKASPLSGNVPRESQGSPRRGCLRLSPRRSGDAARSRAPHHLWFESNPLEPAEVGAGGGQQVGQQLVTQQERQQTEVEQLRMRRTVVVLFKFHPRVVQMHDPCSARSIGDHLRQLTDGERLGELVEDPELAGLRWVPDRQLDASERVADVEETASLSALAVDRQGLTCGRLDHKAIKDRAKDGVVVQ